MIVYKIFNEVNQKLYIGCTVQPIELRFSQHVAMANRGDGWLIHRAMRKYGVHIFDIKLIEEVDNIQELYNREKFWINFYDSIESGYNLSLGGEAPMLGKSMSFESRKKMSKSHMGKRNVNFGKPLSASHRRKISESKYGSRHSPQTKLKMSKAHSGSNNSRSKDWLITKPSGEMIRVTDRKKFCEDHDLNYNSFRSSCLKGKEFKGYFCESIR